MVPFLSILFFRTFKSAGDLFMSVLIINPMNDIHCSQMAQRLGQRGIDFLELKSPAEHDYAFVDGQLIYDGKPIRSVQGVYFRSLLKQQSSASEDAAGKYIEQVQFMAQAEAVRSWMAALHRRGVRVINPPQHNYKYVQLYVLQQLGIPIPKTCITSSPELARSFVGSVKKAVCKPLPGGSYCRRVDEQLLEQLRLIENEPVIFQEEVPGVDIRVNMILGEVISSHIIKKEEDILDYRMDEDYQLGTSQYEEVHLPDEVIAYCDQAMQALGLIFSGIDLRRTPDGRFVLLECNSMPAFLDIEMKTGAPITDRLIDEMISGPPIFLSQEPPDVSYSFQSKTGTAPKGGSLFRYDQAAAEYAARQEDSTNAVLLRLNEEQIKQIKRETGQARTFAHVIVQDGKTKVVQMW